jgi:diguanylate cyclase (GGDEF)-like protein
VDSVVAVAGVAGAVTLILAITAAREWRRARRAEHEIGRLQQHLAAERHAASHDHLTGLPNRRSFYCLGARLIEETARRPLVAILVDLDDFKRINDTFGHRAGDEVLVNVARRLAGLTGGGLVARLGGDEFVALLDQPAAYSGRSAANGDWLAKTAGRMTEVLSVPVPVTGGWRVAVRASIGCVTVPVGVDLDEVLERADAAMYRAKTALAQPATAPGPGRTGPSDPGGWFCADEQRRQVRAVAGDALTWS